MRVVERTKRRVSITMKERTFEERLDKLFSEAVGVEDTIWYTNTETLRDAILREYQERIHEIFG